MSIKLINARVDISNVPSIDGKDQESLVIRGIIAPESFSQIKIAPYQREVIPGVKADVLLSSLKTSVMPDLDLGMRGDKYRTAKEEPKDKESTIFYLQDEVFVIDGLQRISAVKKLLGEDSSFQPRMGAMVHLNTTEVWETERFRILNQDRLKLNANILLRNARTTSPAMDMIYKLATGDPSFVLFEKVQWSQRKGRTELMTAMILCQTAGYLHSRFGPGRGRDMAVVKSLDKTMETIGRNTMRDNIKTFLEVLDECFGVKKVTHSHSAPFLRSTFLVALADVFTRHTDFWRGNRLTVERNLRGKIAKFDVFDPSIANLASSGGKAKDILYFTLVDHINNGKRTRRLTPVDGMEPKVSQEEGDEGEQQPIEGK